MIAEVAIIATFVILFDEILKAFYWPMSRQLGPYVGLIVTPAGCSHHCLDYDWIWPAALDSRRTGFPGAQAGAN